jgi:hypothetical protein
LFTQHFLEKYSSLTFADVSSVLLPETRALSTAPERVGNVLVNVVHGEVVEKRHHETSNALAQTAFLHVRNGFAFNEPHLPYRR